MRDKRTGDEVDPITDEASDKYVLDLAVAEPAGDRLWLGRLHARLQRFIGRASNTAARGAGRL
jgi:hypothetical protein